MPDNSGDPDNQLQDGFQELFTFHEHRLNLRGFGLVEWTEESRRQSDFNMQQTYISWDVKQVLLWKYDFNPGHSPKLLHQVKFSNQPNFICAIVHVPRMKVFLAAALDMTFKIFDRNLKLLESIHHEERAILQLELDPAKDIIYSSGANGISAWRLYRNTSVDKAHIMEKLYSFEDCDKWVTHMIYEPRFNRIYALKERSVQVLSTTRRSVITTLVDVHDAPVNVVCWYERNQFYMTGCSRGEIKCWTSNFNQKSTQLSSSFVKSNDNPGNMFSLLHTFKGHTKAVTALRLHPVSGLAISTSLDGFLKVLNLEALNELFSIQLGIGISGMRIINIGMHHHGVLMSTSDATIKLWKITSLCDFFGVTSSKIARLETFENIEAELELHHRQKRRDLVMQGGGFDVAALKLRSHSSDSQDTAGKDSDNDRDAPTDTTAEKKKKEIPVTYADGGDINDKILVTYSTQDLRAFSHTGQLLGRLEPEHVVEGIKDFCVSVYQKLLFCLCDGDRVFVFDLRRFTFPLIQEFSLRGQGGTSSATSAMAAVMARYNVAASNRENNENNNGSPTIPLPRQESPPRQANNDAPNENASPTGGHESYQHRPFQNINIVEDLGVCCELIDVGPALGLRAPRFTPVNTEEQQQFKTDARGQRIPDYIESYLLVGMKNGAILFLDTLNNFEVQMNFQATNGIVVDMKYRRRQRELIVLGQDLSQTYSNVRIWRLPDMDFLGEFGNMKMVNCFSISLALNFFAVGMSDGNVRLFNHDPEEAKIREIVKSGESHAQEVTSLCFCDELRIYFSASLDGKVKIWDYEKRLIRTVALNLPTCAVVPNGLVGDVIMAQNHYLLTIPKRIWNEDEILETMRQEFEANASEDIPENIMDEIMKQRSLALAKQQQQPHALRPPTSASHTSGASGDAENRDVSPSEKETARERTDSHGSHEGGANSDDEKHPEQQFPTSSQSEKIHRRSVSDRRSSRQPLNPEIKRNTITIEDKLVTEKTPRRNTGSMRTAGDLFARKASSSILINSRRKASLSMSRNSLRNSQILQSMSTAPTTQAERMTTSETDMSCTGDFSQSSSSTNTGKQSHRASFGNKNKDSSLQDTGKMVSEIDRHAMEAIEKEVLLPSLKQHQYRFVSGQTSTSEHSQQSHLLHQQSFASSASSQLSPRDLVTNNSSNAFISVSIGTVRLPKDAMDVTEHFSETIQPYYQPKPPPSSVSSISQQLDVLHPRFLIHDKPPARMIKLEDVDRHLQQLQQKMIANNAVSTDRQKSVSNNNLQSVDYPTKQGQFGLSPRARLTLIHSSPMLSSGANAGTVVMSGEHGVGGVSQQVDPTFIKRSDFEVAHQQHQQLQAQQAVILNMALGMQVSQQYKQHRQTLNASREQRLSAMKQRLSVVSQTPILPAALIAQHQQARNNQATNNNNNTDGHTHLGVWAETSEASDESVQLLPATNITTAVEESKSHLEKPRLDDGMAEKEVGEMITRPAETVDTNSGKLRRSFFNDSR